LLSDVLALIATNYPAKRTVAANQDDEMRKRIFALGLEGAPMILLDNIDGDLGSPSLASALTSDTIQDRVLGATATKSVRLRAVWLANGPLGLKAAETSPATDGFEIVITEIVTRYDEAVGRKAQHAMAEISKLVRERAKRRPTREGGTNDWPDNQGRRQALVRGADVSAPVESMASAGG
jgi:hypothetical protein